MRWKRGSGDRWGPWRRILGTAARGDMLGLIKDSLAEQMGALPSIRLDGDRVYLRPPRARDAKAWIDLRGRSRQFLEPWEPTWPDDALARPAFTRRLKRQVQEWKADEAYAFLIMEGQSDRLLGGINIANIRRNVAQTASLGYWIGAGFERQGYMTEAVVMAVGFAFQQLGLHRIEAACLPRNEASRRLLQKVGFTHEGLARDFLRIAGRWEDHLLFAMIRRDFEAWGRD